MLAEFDHDGEIVIGFEYPMEVKVCADIAKEVEGMPDIPPEAHSVASFIVSLTVEAYRRDDMLLPKFHGQDADGFIEFLDIGARVTSSDAQRMFARSVIWQLQAQGVDVNTLIAI